MRPTRLAPTAALVIACAALPATGQDAPAAWAMKPALAGVDRDGDGLFSPEELGGSEIDPLYDGDGDGLLDLAEITAALFAASDLDDSGALEPEELEAMRGLAAAGVYVPEM